MSEPVAASGTVHWVGAGLSTGSGLGLVCDAASSVVAWSRTPGRAAERLDRLGLTGRARPRTYDPAVLAAELSPGDVVVSMVPATEHPGLLALCRERGAHFGCTSYVSDGIAAQVDDAAAAGLVVLTEAGLDPGIDHLLAHDLVARGSAALGGAAVTADFTSYCGGVPAEPNEFRYRFSWAPRGVLTALRSPARYLAGGTEEQVAEPWTATRRLDVRGETFEAYPNRDSLPFLAQYGLPAGWTPRTFVRGTLRPAGWQEAWAPVFAELRTGTDASVAALAALADELAQRYPTRDVDRDRVVLAVALALTGPDGAAWSGEYVLELVGDAAESALARCVSLPVAHGVRRILAGRLRPGLHRAAEDAAGARAWLVDLAATGIRCDLRETTGPR